MWGATNFRWWHVVAEVAWRKILEQEIVGKMHNNGQINGAYIY
jgi:hypothetical protein